ncbi:MAG TPA: transglycosylase domain-containing protein [Burkholderiales bacterium]|nr:transglycosylase domain-containing protein [Burkholderiales bacterium]
MIRSTLYFVPGPPPLAARPRLRGKGAAMAAVGACALVALAYWEMRTSTLQAGPFAWSARKLHYAVAPGPSDSIRFPAAGPYDERLGYSRLPRLLERLTAQGYVVDAQARSSSLLARFIDLGLFPIYRVKTQAGLTLADCGGRAVCALAYPQRAYREFASVPPLVVQSLLFIENRELLDPRYPHRNPAVEWDRLGYAVAQRMLSWSSGARTPGGSTLATQMEKYRHSPGGRTGSASEKLRQMVSASLRAYLSGDRTLPVRQQIVVDYLNTMPLAAAAGVGEVFGVGDGLRIWYGADFDDVNRRLHQPAGDPESLAARAVAYRQVLSLLIAQRRPSGLLAGDRERLADLTDSYLRLLAQDAVVDRPLLEQALEARALAATRPAARPASELAEHKAVYTMRARLAGLLGLERVYQVDRLDLRVETPLLGGLQADVARVLSALADPAGARAAGLMEERLLARGDPAQVVYSFILLERTPAGNLVRVQADTSAQPFDVNEGAKLDLGSTAKLRTLITYLELVAELHRRFVRLERAALYWVPVNERDSLTRWALDYLLVAQDRSLPAMLDAAMRRRYSASPGETFFTGGGLHRFENFRSEDDARIVTVSEAFRESINLPFVRMMREIVQHLMFGPEAPAAYMLHSPVERAAYLARFADSEGRVFLRRFHARYRGLEPDRMLDVLASRTRASPVPLTVAFRSVAPWADAQALARFLERHLSPGSRRAADELHARYAPERMTLADRAYLAGVHPLELWLVGYLSAHPGAGLPEAVAASGEVRQSVYDWLFRTRHRRTQELRILSMREAEAFREIHRRWKRLGYPFDSLVPSYATAIGSSADRPAALAELAGIVVNGGVRLPTVRIHALHFAAGTPYETRMVAPPRTPEAVLAPEVAATVRRALTDVVANGTARRLGPVLALPDGTVLKWGGKTGTGDHRFETYGPGGRLIDSRVVSRAATFVFTLGERYFGTVTAYVHGAQAQRYGFTSSLPVQVLKALAPVLARDLGVPCEPDAARPATTSVQAQRQAPEAG